MTNYEQLQEFLNKCIELGWKPRGRKMKKVSAMTDKFIIFVTKETKEYISQQDFEYHSLFSIDSWLLGFINWKRQLNDIILTPWYDNKWYINVNKTLSWGMPEYHYMIMWPMTAEEKITYFLENALLPTNTDEH